MIVASGGRRALGAAFIALTVGAAGCVESNKPDASACAAPSTEIVLTVTASSLSPDDPAVCRGQRVTLRVESTVDGVLHVHGYDAELPAIEVRASEPAEIAFDATRSGQFPIEFHTEQEAEGSSAGVLTVHEP